MSIYKLSLRDNHDRTLKEHCFTEYETALAYSNMLYEAKNEEWVNTDIGFGRRGFTQAKGNDILLIEKMVVI